MNRNRALQVPPGILMSGIHSAYLRLAHALQKDPDQISHAPLCLKK
jgi:hypothetical protein